MTREDKILGTFLTNAILKEKYDIDVEKYKTIDMALMADEPIVKAIAMIVHGLLDSSSNLSSKSIYQQVTGYLNKAV